MAERLDENVMGGFGRFLSGAGLLLSGITWLVTVGYFFSEGETALGLILLVVPPAELMLPSLATTTLGAMSAVGFLMTVVGFAARKD